MFVLLTTGNSNGTGNDKTLDGCSQRFRNIIYRRFRIVSLVTCGHKGVAVRNRENNGQKIIVLIGISRSAEDLFGTDVVARSRKVDDEILGEKIVLVERNKDVGKWGRRIADISRPIEQLDDLADISVYGGRVVTGSTGIYGSIVRSSSTSSRDLLAMTSWVDCDFNQLYSRLSTETFFF